MNCLQTWNAGNTSRLRKCVLIIASAAGLGLTLPSAPAIAQDEEGALAVEEIVVTARRREEELQDVPVSLTYFDQKQLNNVNMFQAGDIAKYTPSLQVNNRFGADTTTFAIRGFTQELRTTASVGVYFAEVVAPRGANTQTSGDGAGPGDMFDLENIQVLKGPQGTLFGRNTTGGAVLLTPKKPTDKFEGYGEVSYGKYDMQRLQGVLNIPVSDNFRMRFGVDQQRRDGYLDNFSGIGPDDYGDVDYVALRASFVWDITDDLENYTILKASDSDNNASPYSVFLCNSAATLGRVFCAPDLARRRAAGHTDFYDVYNFVPDSHSEQEQWQVINTTTWKVNDRLTVKNILSYVELETRMNFALYGTDWRSPDLLLTGAPNPSAGQPITFQVVNSRSDLPTTDQRSFVEELQLQGTAFDDRLTWQAGAYFERSKPIGQSGSYGPAMISCDPSTIGSADPGQWRCNDLLRALFFQPIPQGSVNSQPGGVTYKNQAIYAEGTYEFTDQWSMTLGLRYTEDETQGWVQETTYYFPGTTAGGYFPFNATSSYTGHPHTRSDAATGVAGVQYKPTEDLMLYGKYSRGYRQGSVNVASVPAFNVHGPETVDTYEIGAKGSFGGPVPGTFNIAAFYNDFEDQQLQFGYQRTNGVGSTSILNAGQSTLSGIEADATFLLTEDFNINISYAYLYSEIDKLVTPGDLYTLAELQALGIRSIPSYSVARDEPLPGTPENKLVATANYRLPVDANLGEVTASMTYIYTDDTQWLAPRTPTGAVSSPLYQLDSYSLFNFSLNWEKIAGSPVDMLLFVTNAFDEEYESYVTGNWGSGLEIGRLGEPRMYGVRLRYNF